MTHWTVDLIDKYYKTSPTLRAILMQHSLDVAHRALQIADAHPELRAKSEFVYEAAMLHDIGIFRTNAPGICCYGASPYICHGFLGAELLRAEGLPRHARVAERHTGAGITHQEIAAQNIPIPLGDYLPETIEEKIVCYADKFYSKSKLNQVKSIEQALKSVSKHGEAGALRFKQWIEWFE